MSENNFRVEIIQSNKESFLCEAVIDCLEQLSKRRDELNGYLVFKARVFIQTEGKYKNEIPDLDLIIKTYTDKYLLPVTLIFQAPLANMLACLEVWWIETKEGISEVKAFASGQSNYTLFSGNGFSLLQASIRFHNNKYFGLNIREAFGKLDNLLAENGFEYKDIVRQWNYIYDILSENDHNPDHVQNYQLFNEYRARHYASSEFDNGYPAATGIGMNYGGLVITVIALKGKTCQIVPIKNPVQHDAHKYSENVLAEIPGITGLSRPLFERGKYCKADTLSILFVSGTASITGEKTVYPGNIEKQTRTTIENIKCLVTGANLEQQGLPIKKSIQMLNYVVYIKNVDDFEKVKSVCMEFFGDIPAIYVHADICRRDLLVEIEANYLLQE
jgi:enamine deaminase RidA (YjgF/YER057c/UK114 family)